MQKSNFFNTLTQISMPALTIAAQAATALKFPEWGLVLGLLAQPFWFYAAWKSYKQAGQIGILITTIIMTIVITAGVINYWLF